MREPRSNADGSAVRENIAKAIRVLVREGLIPNAGHISVRPPDADWFWTLRHVHVGLDEIGPGDIIACDMDGRSLDPAWQASGERFIYTEIFRSRPDVRAIAHFHPPIAIAFSIARKPLLPILMLGAHIGEVPQYDVPEPIESPTAGRALAQALGRARAVLLRGHGAVTVGETVEDVCALAVMLEHSARMQQAASALGEVKPIDTKGREKIFADAFIHFRDVLWDHHRRGDAVTPFLAQRII